MRRGKTDFFDYEGFCEKFVAPKTTDDCYTPPAVYQAVLDWVRKEYAISETATILRPFQPGGDYQKCDYPAGCAVIDNPPFSILSQIVAFYNASAIPFFLFAPALTCLNNQTFKATIIAVNVNIEYENGAKVPTSFVTNMAPADIVLDTPPELFKAIEKANERKDKKTTAKASTPEECHHDFAYVKHRAKWPPHNNPPKRVPLSVRP